ITKSLPNTFAIPFLLYSTIHHTVCSLRCIRRKHHSLTPLLKQATTQIRSDDSETMLLPSSLDCAPRKHPRTASYIPATTMLSPSSSTCQSPNSTNMYSTCRALQTLLTSNLPTLTPSPKTIRAPPHLGSPIALTSAPRAAQPMKKTKSHAAQPAKATTSRPPRTPPRSNLKRRRSSIDDQRAPSPDHENLQHAPGRNNQEILQQHLRPSTPKRQRTYPPTLPLGLNRSDFAALPSPTTPPHTPSPKPPSSSSCDPENQSQNNTNNTTNNTTTNDSPPWSTHDDSALVALILSKLQLRQSDWDECARRLGKGKDSIGKRWRFLLGDGGVGLRRGRGERRRGGVGGVIDFGGVLGEERR
ncbi:hypothetical protein BDR22DRAFT_918561, partial [Usnea florida]